MSLTLPLPSSDASEHSARLVACIAREIIDAGGWISFERYMALVLYAPGLGYYTAGSQKFGSVGDFVTAPEMTAFFGRALARQVAQIMSLSAPQVLEAGAGSGRLAADLLLELEQLGQLPDTYFILDLSADLRQRQRATLAKAVPHLLDRVQWLDCLPETFGGVVLANELLDAMPAHIVAWRETDLYERGVALDEQGRFTWRERVASGALRSVAEGIGEQCTLPPGFESEISLANRAWAAEWGHRPSCGALLLIDYGFPRREYYHQQRGRGTLMCHYRHHAHPDPFYLPGLQDVTVHVDFTAIIEAAHGAGLALLGYTSQGQFLLNCGVLASLAELDSGSTDYIRAASAINKLLMPHEMGELFKAIAIGKGIDEPLCGFASGDQSHRL